MGEIGLGLGINETAITIRPEDGVDIRPEDGVDLTMGGDLLKLGADQLVMEG